MGGGCSSLRPVCESKEEGRKPCETRGRLWSVQTSPARFRFRFGIPFVFLGLSAVGTLACGGGPDVHLASKTTPEGAKSVIVLGDAHAQNAEGESLWLHLDGRFEYLSASGSVIVRGRLTSDTIFDGSDRVVATIAPDGKLTESEPTWSKVDQGIDADGGYFLRGKPWWKIDGAGNLVEAQSGSIVLKTADVPSRLRRAMVLAEFAISVSFRRGFRGAAAP